MNWRCTRKRSMFSEGRCPKYGDVDLGTQVVTAGNCYPIPANLRSSTTRLYGEDIRCTLCQQATKPQNAGVVLPTALNNLMLGCTLNHVHNWKVQGHAKRSDSIVHETRGPRLHRKFLRLTFNTRSTVAQSFQGEQLRLRRPFCNQEHGQASE